MSELNRRQFLHVAAAATCAGACGLSCTKGGRSDGGGGSPEPAQVSGPVEVGALAEYAREGPYDRFAEDEGVLLIVSGGRLIATSAVCTHRRATLTVKGGRIVCPKHGSRFGNDGVPLNGPARTPLPRFAVAVDGNGRLIVDRSTTFSEERWDRPGSYVSVG